MVPVVELGEGERLKGVGVGTGAGFFLRLTAIGENYDLENFFL